MVMTVTISAPAARRASAAFSGVMEQSHQMDFSRLFADSDVYSVGFCTNVCGSRYINSLSR